MCFIYDYGKILSRCAFNFFVNNREFLQSRYNHSAPVIDGIQQIPWIFALANRFDCPESMVKAWNGVLQLCIKNGSVRDDDYRRENRLIHLIMQRG